jgi:hypothetical protein
MLDIIIAAITADPMGTAIIGVFIVMLASLTAIVKDIG